MNTRRLTLHKLSFRTLIILVAIGSAISLAFLYWLIDDFHCASAILKYKMAVRDKILYNLEYQASGQTDIGSLFANNPALKTSSDPASLRYAFNTNLKSVLEVTVLSKKDEEMAVVYGFKNVDLGLLINSQESAQSVAQLQLDMAKPVYAGVDRYGKIVSVMVDSTVTELSSSIIRTLLALSQLVLPQQAVWSDSLLWRAQEEDANGRYWAQYRAKLPTEIANMAPHRVEFSKNKVEYIKTVSKSSSRNVQIAQTIIPNDECTIQFDRKSGLLLSITGQESRTIYAGRTNIGNAVATFGLNIIKKEIISSKEIAHLQEQLAERENQGNRTSLYSPRSGKATKRSVAKKQLGSACLNSILAELEKVDKIPKPNLDITPLFLKVKAFMYIHPDSTKYFGNLLNKADVKSRTFRVIVQALSNSGHAQAQNVMINAIKIRQADATVSLDLLQTLGMLDEPSLETENFFIDLAKYNSAPELGACAKLSLGVIASKLAEEQPERAEKIVSLLLKQLNSAKDSETFRLLLKALGNAGSTQALPTVAQCTSNLSPDLRATALYALRFIESEEAEALILKALRMDVDARVRIAAARTWNYRDMTPEAFAAQQEVFEHGGDTSLRFVLLRNLWQAKDDFPEAVQIVFDAALQDTSEDIRKAARELMIQNPNDFSSR